MNVMVWFYNHREALNPLMDDDQNEESDDDDDHDSDDEEDTGEEDELDQVIQFLTCTNTVQVQMFSRFFLFFIPPCNPLTSVNILQGCK